MSRQGNSNPPLELFRFLSLRYQAWNQQMGAGKWQGKMVTGSSLAYLSKVLWSLSVFDLPMETLKHLVKSMLFKLHSSLLTSKLHLLWHHLSIHHELPSLPDNAVLLFQTRSFSSSAHTYPSSFHKSLIFHSSRKILLDLSVGLKHFLVSRFSLLLVHMSIPVLEPYPGLSYLQN